MKTTLFYYIYFIAFLNYETDLWPHYEVDVAELSAIE